MRTFSCDGFSSGYLVDSYFKFEISDVETRRSLFFELPWKYTSEKVVHSHCLIMRI